MTITFNDTDTAYQFTVNGYESIASNYLRFTSLYSKEVLFYLPVTSVDGNNRYVTHDFTLPAPLGDQHINGIYKYELVQDFFGEQQTIQSGVVKIYTTPGGETGTQPYISNNENREGTVYFRPSYE